MVNGVDVMLKDSDGDTPLHVLIIIHFLINRLVKIVPVLNAYLLMELVMMLLIMKARLYDKYKIIIYSLFGMLWKKNSI